MDSISDQPDYVGFGVILHSCNWHLNYSQLEKLIDGRTLLMKTNMQQTSILQTEINVAIGNREEDI